MAICLNTNPRHPSIRCEAKPYLASRLRSPFLLGIGRPSLNAQFYGKVRKSLQCGTHNDHPTRSRITMMPIGMPRVPYRTPGEGTTQWVDIWNALYRERIIFIGQHMDEAYSNQILGTMLYLDSIDDSKRLHFFICSPGGDLTPSLAIYDTMQSLQSASTMFCVGYAYNLAGFLVAAGEKGHRLAMPLARIALQSPAGVARGQADDVQNEANELLRVRDYLYNELAKNTGQPAEKIYEDLSRIKRFSAQEALEYGLIDRIARPSRIKADAPRKSEDTILG
ncbi:hypothetical protein SLA2020_498680 [Shorea laevis]